MAVLKLDSSQFPLVIMPVLAIGSWEYSSLMKMSRWLAKALYVSALMGSCLFFKSNAILVNATFNCHVVLVGY